MNGKWTSDEVRELLLKIAGGPISIVQRVELFDIASNYAERIEADERVRPPAQAAQVDRRVAIRLAQYGAEYSYRHKGWSIESLQDGCEEHIDGWIKQVSSTTSDKD